MSQLINRRPAPEELVEQIRAHHTVSWNESFRREDLTDEGKALLDQLTVEGSPPDGLARRETKWGRGWCAYLTVD